MLNVISLGAGKQSSYMLIRALRGEFPFFPDYAIFSDTHSEPSYVYSYLDWLKSFCLNEFNFTITIVSTGNLYNDTLNYISDPKKRNPQPPLRYGDNDGILNRHCTMDYKIIPLRKELQKIRHKQKIRLWIGISLDEIERQKISQTKYIQHYYPLIDSKISLSSIISWYHNNNLPEPGKSACLFCPFHTFNYWQTFKRQFPDDFKKACEFDNAIRIYPKIKSKMYLSRKLKPLQDIDFDSQPSLFPELIEECHGLCGL